jgi:hypothetical protein
MMTWSSAGRWTVGASLAVAFATSVSCTGGASFTLNQVIVLHQGQTLVPVGSGCSSVTLPGSGGGDAEPRIGDFNYSEGADGDTYQVSVFSDQDLLAQRQYTESMLASGTVDTFSVTTHAGAVYTLSFWGGRCTAIDVGSDASSD